MTNHVEGKVIVITGAASGFGRLVAERTAAMGARVVGADLSEEALTATTAAIRDAGGEVTHLVTDVTDKHQMDALARHAVATYGRIDVLVNNAGVMPLAFFADHAAAWEAWERCIDVNLKGVLNGITAVHDQMMEQGRGHIVNLSSIYGNFPNAGAGVYTATKAAVNILSETLRVESQGRIKVTIVKPTGVPATNLGSTVVNGEAIVGILGAHFGEFMEHAIHYASGTLPAEKTDPDHPQYWTIEPDELAEQIVYVINQPWGVSISDITVRATGEQYIL